MIISLAMDDRFADEGPNIKPRVKGIGEDWFRAEIERYQKHKAEKAQEGNCVARNATRDELIGIPLEKLREAASRANQDSEQRSQRIEQSGGLYPAELDDANAPTGSEYALLFDLNSLLQQRYDSRNDYQVNYLHAPIPTDMPNYFTDGRTFIRGTFKVTRYDKALYIHVDFKEKIELYIIHQINLRNTARRMYIFERPDSISMFRAITSEMELVLNGDFKD